MEVDSHLRFYLQSKFLFEIKNIFFGFFLQIESLHANVLEKEVLYIGAYCLSQKKRLIP